MPLLLASHSPRAHNRLRHVVRAASCSAYETIECNDFVDA